MEELSPRARAKRRQITDAARALFLSQGFARTSMDAITAEAGVSKQTLYAYFPSKAELLLAILDEAQQSLATPADGRAPTSRAELRQALLSFSHRLIDTMLRDEVLAVLRLALGEAVHVPEVRPTFLQALPLALLGRARAILEAAAGNGVVVLDHPDVSVRMLVGPLMSYVVFGGLMATGVAERPADEAVEWLVDAYLRTLDFTDADFGDAS
ncbi:MAG: TetR/AcrR family transcriptional regulator [Micropruina sp.]|uniref:TetR/AcrR family transcriptional regulator n=1 Tax=Micropruina sp. TaxID=2737536 RepID=UPI0039E3C96E